MDRDDITKILLDRFYENFAAETSKIIMKNGNFDRLYEIAIGNNSSTFSKSVLNTLTFRATYVLEYIYFEQPELFNPHKEHLLNNFDTITSESAKRHFGKIVFDVLKHTRPTDEQCEKIAESCIIWVTNPKVRVAVQIWAIEILIRLQERVSWLSEIMPDLVASVMINSTPALNSRHKRWRKKISQ